MKNIKKLAGLLLALIMALALAVPALAEGTGTITIDNAVVGNTYTLYKVFDAAGNGTDKISYRLVAGKSTAPAGFTVDAAGNVTYTGTGTGGQLTEGDIAAIAGYVTDADRVGEPITATGSTVIFENLDDGYYYITTTTGTAVTINSANHAVTVQDKNEAPDLDKEITGVGAGSLDDDGQRALAQVGTVVHYAVTIDVKNGAEKYVFHDKMSTGLTYNNDVEVFLPGTVKVDPSDDTFNETTAEGDTITLTFNDAWIAQQVGTTITVTYSATVNSDALTVDPAKNTASIAYGDNEVVVSSPHIPEVYNAKFTVTKQDGDGQPLAGAGFVLKRVKAGTAPATYEYYKKEGNMVSWVEDIAEATELTTTAGAGGNVIAFTGLADGSYTLVEKTVPAGYNRAEDSTFTIAAHNYETANLEQAATVTNEAGVALPTTGGIGTTLFYIIGGLLAAGAVVLLVAKRRMDSDN